jgi:hypothetical protein
MNQIKEKMVYHRGGAELPEETIIICDLRSGPFGCEHFAS